MRTKDLLMLPLIVTIAFNLFGCGKREDSLERKLNSPYQTIRTINGIDYELILDKLTQKTKDEDDSANFGIIADPHGFYEEVKTFCEFFKHEKLDGIIMLGDYAQHFRKKQNPKLSDYDEITNCIESALKTGLPVYVIPGNHETRKDYERSIKKLSKDYTNLFDLSKIRIVDGDDFDLVSNPYGNDRGFSYFRESFLNENDKMMDEIINYVKLLKQDNDPEILITHQPPKCAGKNGIDVILNGKNVGNEYINKAMRDAHILFSLSGHIHEAWKGINSHGDLIKQDNFFNELRFNPGSVSKDEYDPISHAGIFTIKGKEAKYKIISLN